MGFSFSLVFQLFPVHRTAILTSAPASALWPVPTSTTSRSRALCPVRRAVSVRKDLLFETAFAWHAVIAAAWATAERSPQIWLSGRTGNVRNAATATAPTIAFTVSSLPATQRNTARKTMACTSAFPAPKPCAWRRVTDTSCRLVASRLTCRALVLSRWPPRCAGEKTRVRKPSVGLFLSSNWRLVTRKETQARQSGWGALYWRSTSMRLKCLGATKTLSRWVNVVENVSWYE